MDYFEQHRQEFLEGLKAFLRIPSISTLSEHKPDIRRAAEFARDRTDGGRNDHGRGVHRRRWQSAGVRGMARRAGKADACSSTGITMCSRPIRWTSGSRRRLSRRFAVTTSSRAGRAMTKARCYIQIKAVEGLLKTTGKLPVNVKFLLEGEEETGGAHIEAYVKTRPPRLKADAALICDTELFAPGSADDLRGAARHCVLRTVGGRREPRPAFRRVWRRGAESADGDRGDSLRAQGSRRPHSDPGLLRPGCAARAKRSARRGRRLPFDEREYTEKEMGARELVGEPDVPLFDRLWARPTLEVHGIRGGFTGEGAKTVIPARATAKISIAPGGRSASPTKRRNNYRRAVAGGLSRGE